jgi:hypothetical protein
VVAGLHGRVLAGTDRGRDGAAVGGEAALGPWEGLVIGVEESRPAV